MNIVDAFFVVIGLKNDQFNADLKKTEKALASFKGKEQKLDQDAARQSADTDRKVAAAKKKQQDADRRAQKERDAMLKKTNDGYRKIIGTIAQVTGVTLGVMGFKNFIADSITASAQLKRVADTTGQSARQLDAMGKVIGTVGGKYEEAAANAQAMSRAVNDFQQGRANQSLFIQRLTSMGIGSLYGQDGKLKDEKTLLIEVSQAFKTADRYKNNPQEQAQAIEDMGWSPSMLYLARKGPQYIEQEFDQNQLSNKDFDAQTQAAERYQQALGRVGNRFREVGQAIFVALEPQINQFLDLLKNFADWVSEHREEIGKFFSGLGTALMAVVGAFVALNHATGGVGGGVLAVVAALVALKAIIGTLVGMTGIPALVGALRGVGAASAGAKAALLGKAGLFVGAAYVGAEAGSAIRRGMESNKRGRSMLDAIGNAGVGVLGWMGLAPREGQEGLLSDKARQRLADPQVQQRLQQEKQSARDDPTEKILHDQTDLQRSALELARQSNQSDDAQISALRKIDESIHSVEGSIRQAYGAGKAGQPLPGGGGASAPAKMAYTAGKTAAWAGNLSETIINGFAKIMTRAEGDYDSVNTGAHGGYRAKRVNLEQMTVAQVMSAQARGDFGAAGRYQMIGSTLRDAVQKMGIAGDAKFDKSLQDKIFADYLLAHKRRAVMDYIDGKSGNLKAALLALSQEWASFANPLTGKSYYAGNGIDAASVSAPQAAQLLQSLRASTLAQAQGAGNSTHTETHIGQLNIHTAATDAQGIAKEIPRATRNAFNDNAALAAA